MKAAAGRRKDLAPLYKWIKPVKNRLVKIPRTSTPGPMYRSQVLRKVRAIVPHTIGDHTSCVHRKKPPSESVEQLVPSELSIVASILVSKCMETTLADTA